MKPLFRALLALCILAPGLASAAPVQLSAPPLTLDARDSFSPLTDAGLKAAFPGNRPDAVYVNADNKVSVTFEWRSSALRPNQLGALLTQFQPVIRAQVPGIKSLRASSVTINGTVWDQFVFVAPGRDGDVRRELLVTSAQNRMVVVTVISTLADYTKNSGAIASFENSFKLN